MATVFAQDVIEIAIEAKYSGRDVVNVLHVRNDETGGDDESKVRDVLDNWQDHVMDVMTADYDLTQATWRSLDPSEGTLGTMAPNAAKPLSGSASGDGSPPNVALLVKKITADRQRGQRDGRMFLPGVPEGQTFADGTLNLTAVGLWQTAVDDFLSGINDTGFTQGSGSGLVVLNTTPESRLPGPQEVTLTYRAVTSLVVDSTLSTQRDRLR